MRSVCLPTSSKCETVGIYMYSQKLCAALTIETVLGVDDITIISYDTILKKLSVMGLKILKYWRYSKTFADISKLSAAVIPKM